MATRRQGVFLSCFAIGLLPRLEIRRFSLLMLQKDPQRVGYVWTWPECRGPSRLVRILSSHPPFFSLLFFYKLRRRLLQLVSRSSQLTPDELASKVVDGHLTSRLKTTPAAVLRQGESEDEGMPVLRPSQNLWDGAAWRSKGANFSQRNLHQRLCFASSATMFHQKKRRSHSFGAKVCSLSLWLPNELDRGLSPS